LVPMGAVRADYLRSLAEAMREQFGLPVELTANQGRPVYALDAKRKQYNSQLIIRKLPQIAPAYALKILGVTDIDLFSPIFSYVFGEAQFHGRCAVVSTFRLHPNPESNPRPGCPPLLDRLEKEAIHELGHTFGLRHCPDPDCVMSYSVGVDCADRKFPYFCPSCRDLLLWHLATDIFLGA